MRLPAVLPWLLIAAAPAAAAEVASPRPDRVAVVLYQDHAPFSMALGRGDDDGFGGDPGLAVVSETRTVELPAGRSRVSFRGVADGMVPQTAAIEGLEGRLIERNYDFDLLSPGALMQKAVGAPARLVRTNARTGEVSEDPVTVRSGPAGIVLEHADGSAEALGCSGLPERLVFDSVPPGLTAVPTLSAEVEAPRAGRYVVRLSYLATGLRWKADYVARLHPETETLDLEGWLTLSNISGTTFGDAPTQVVAGRLMRDGDDHPAQANAARSVRSCWPLPPPPPAPAAARNSVSFSPIVTLGSNLEEVVVTGSRVTASDFGDYKLYSLNEPTTVAANQTKQVVFLSQPAVRYSRAYAYVARPSYEGIEDDAVQPAEVKLVMDNKAAEGLGKALPGGTVTVLEPKPDGGSSLAGQPEIGDTPVGLSFELAVGQSPRLTVAPVQGELTRFKRAGQELTRSEVTLTVRNAGDSPAELIIGMGLAHLKLLKESRPHIKRNGWTVWTVPVPAEGEATLTYRTEDR